MLTSYPMCVKRRTHRKCQVLFEASVNDSELGRDDIIEIDPERLVRMCNLHVSFLLFDLRAENEFSISHIRGAVHILAAEFLKKLPGMVPQKDIPIVIYDDDGVGAGDLVASAEKLGFI